MDTRPIFLVLHYKGTDLLAVFKYLFLVTTLRDATSAVLNLMLLPMKPWLLLTLILAF